MIFLLITSAWCLLLLASSHLGGADNGLIYPLLFWVGLRPESSWSLYTAEKFLWLTGLTASACTTGLSFYWIREIYGRRPWMHSLEVLAGLAVLPLSLRCCYDFDPKAILCCPPPYCFLYAIFTLAGLAAAGKYLIARNKAKDANPARGLWPVVAILAVIAVPVFAIEFLRVMHFIIPLLALPVWILSWRAGELWHARRHVYASLLLGLLVFACGAFAFIDDIRWIGVTPLATIGSLFILIVCIATWPKKSHMTC